MHSSLETRQFSAMPVPMSLDPSAARARAGIAAVMAFGSTEHLSLRSAQHSKTIWHLKIMGFAGGLYINLNRYLLS